MKLNEDYHLTFDKYNVILNEKYEKRVVRGKNAALSGEYSTREVGYFRSPRAIADQIEMLTLNKFQDLEEVVVELEKIKDEMTIIIGEAIQFGKEQYEREVEDKKEKGSVE